jgi:signal transduction histidine kinase
MPAIASKGARRSGATWLRSARARLERWAIRERPQRSRRWLPRPTVRLRLTLLYGTLFLVAGTLLLAITYGLVAQSVSAGNRTSVVVRADRNPVGLGPGVLSFVQVKGKLQNVAFPPRFPPNLAQTAKRLQSATQVAISNNQSATLDALVTKSGVALGIMALVSIGLGWLMAGRALAPVRTMSARVRQISEHNLHERLALDGHDDELKELGNTFDGLLERLQHAFESQRAFVANASHELRTPVTVERTLLEVALADPNANVDSLRATCGRVLEAGEQQERTIEALLTLARSQRGLQAREPVDLAAVACEAAAAVDGGRVELECTFEPANALGDPVLLERLAANLLVNAIQHNREHGCARAWTGFRNGRPTLTVTNTGPVIAPEDVGALLEPFRRLNGARNRHDGGIGLGLSIVGAIAAAHGADLSVNPRSGGGLEVAVSLPPR